MHIPDGYLGPQTYVPLFGVSAAFWGAGLKKMKAQLSAKAADGTPLYAPYPLSIALPAMVGEHAILYGLVDGLVTALLVKTFVKNVAGMVFAMKEA